MNDVEGNRSDESISSPILLAVRDYWLEKKGGKRFPGRSDIDPTEITSLLPSVFLIDVFSDPIRFKYRLVGTAITAMFGRDSTGKWVDEALYGASLEQILISLSAAVESKEPYVVRRTVPYVQKDWVTVEISLFPLGDDDTRVSMILGGIDLVNIHEVPPVSEGRVILNWRD